MFILIMTMSMLSTLIYSVRPIQFFFPVLLEARSKKFVYHPHALTSLLKGKSHTSFYGIMDTATVF